ncbi:PREDICTED: vacuolar iron transporter homolog 2.1-like [Camelina sativa]|uniref:Vacuolar iron transporter n=1 Tax=Camelina sativa TaxID=90675 RepID=A0ABM0W7U6_CAMSA|nr:PREDICTED: vacuolar iron transporter homolog 2.1-like [Camelina sativa]
MASNFQLSETISPRNQKSRPREEKEEVDYMQRAQWLRAALLGANDGLVTVASLMMGVGSIKEDVKAMLLVGFAGLVAGACSMAIGEFVSVCTQRDIETAQMKRAIENKTSLSAIDEQEEEEKKERLPNPGQAAIASALAFSVGAAMPLLAAVFIENHKVRMAVVAVVATIALVVFGVTGAVLGKTSVVKSSVRVVIGGWMAMALTFGLTKFIGSAAMQI